MKDSEKSQEIVNKHFEWISNFVENNNLSKEDRNQIRYKMYSACQEMAEWKEKDMMADIRVWLREICRVCDITDEQGYPIDARALLASFEKSLKGGKE